MDANEFNEWQLEAGNITPDHISELTRYFQANHDLKVDGKLGKISRAELGGGDENVAIISPLASTALALAISEIGMGESGANNRGPDIEHWLATDGTGRPADTDRMGWLWCASFVSSCLVRAAESLGTELSFETSRGARDLGRKMLRGECRQVAAAAAAPGDVFVIKRRGGHHTGFVEMLVDSAIVGTVEGNVGRFPALVKRMTRDLQNEDLVYLIRP